MTPDFEHVSVQAYRVGRAPEPLAWPPFEHLMWDGRFDDPDRVSRTLYLADSVFGAWVEVLARFRPDPLALDHLARVEGEAGDVPTNTGVPMGWLASRRVVAAEVAGRVAEVGNAVTLRWLEARLRDWLTDRRVETLGLAEAVGADRELTQRVAWTLRLHGDAAIVSYPSRHGEDIRCYAVFESDGSRLTIDLVGEPVGPDLEAHDGAFMHALRHHDLSLGPAAER